MRRISNFDDDAGLSLSLSNAAARRSYGVVLNENQYKTSDAVRGNIRPF